VSSILRQNVLRRGRPTWLWYTLHARHVPWVRAVGIAWAPHAFLTETRRAAAGLLLADHAILRVQVNTLDAYKLRKEESWEAWRTERQSSIRPPLDAYLRYLQPELPELRDASLRGALRPALGRVQGMWAYWGIIPASSLSIKDEDSEFYRVL